MRKQITSIKKRFTGWSRFDIFLMCCSLFFAVSSTIVAIIDYQHDFSTPILNWCMSLALNALIVANKEAE